MILNPFDEKLANAEREAADIDAAIQLVLQKVEWFERTNVTALRSELDELRLKAAEISRERDYVDYEVRQLAHEIQLVSDSIGPFWNPMNWLDSRQSAARARKRDLTAAQGWATERLCNAQFRLGDVQRCAADREAEIERYVQFDPAANTHELEELRRRRLQQREQIETAARRKAQVDAALNPILLQLMETERKKAEAVVALDRAQRFERELSQAENSYERAMVHQKCEGEFGTGSPRQVIHRRETEIRRLDRDREKLQARARNVAKRAARDVNRLLLDGSNLCYEGDKFIGLDALRVLVPALVGAHEVVVVFDASITKDLSKGDVEIRDALGGNAKIHIVAPGIDADETVLDLAGSDPTTFIVSNDRFVEFAEKSAVRDDRLIRHEVVAGRVLIHDLGVAETFEW